MCEREKPVYMKACIYEDGVETHHKKYKANKSSRTHVTLEHNNEDITRGGNLSQEIQGKWKLEKTCYFRTQQWGHH